MKNKPNLLIKSSGKKTVRCLKCFNKYFWVLHGEILKQMCEKKSISRGKLKLPQCQFIPFHTSKPLDG